MPPNSNQHDEKSKAFTMSENPAKKTPRLTLVIQAGGESRRMGQDKALVPFLGRPLIERVLGRLSHLADEILVTTNRPESLRFLGLPLAADLVPGRGALGGLYTALSAASGDLVAVVACDMPFASPSLLAYARDQIAGPPAPGEAAFDIAIPNNGSALEPFHAVYRRETCLPPLLAALEAGRWRADAWFSAVRLRLIPLDEMAHLNVSERAFWNVNTPADLQQAEELARQSQPGEDGLEAA
jgi:molybdenum cofactor guanylyltransferase